MKHPIIAAMAALALAACADSGPLLEGRAAPAQPVLDIVWGPIDSIFTTQVPAENGYAGPDGWQAGTTFTAEDTLLIVGFKYYKGSGETGSHTAKLYTLGGTLVASAGFTTRPRPGGSGRRLGLPRCRSRRGITWCR